MVLIVLKEAEHMCHNKRSYNFLDVFMRRQQEIGYE